MPIDDIIDEERAAYLAASGLQRLVDLGTTMRTAQDGDARSSLLATFLHDEDGVDEVAVALVLRAHDADRELLALRGSVGAGVHTQLSRVLRRRAREMEARRKGFRVHDRDEPTETRSLRAACGEPETWPDYPVPTGYTVLPDGAVCREVPRDGGVALTLVATEPVAVIARKVDLATDAGARVVVGYRFAGQWRTMTIGRSEMGSARRLVQHADRGLPVADTTALELVRFLVACEAAGSAEFASSEYVSRLGWFGDRYVCGPAGPIDLDEDLEHRRRAWRPRGTLDGWKRALAHVTRHPVPWLGLYAACCPILLRFVGLEFCPIYDFHGPRGCGKTSGPMYLGASVYGRPAIDRADAGEGVIGTWLGTSAGREERAAEGWYVPMFLDDTNLLDERGKQGLGAEVYRLVAGRGKERSRRAGFGETLTWRVCVLSTGEEPLIGYTEAGGARVRVLSIPSDRALPDRRTAEALHAALLEHHGHVAPLFASKCLELGAAVLRERLDEAMTGWGEQVEADTRLVTSAALLSLAAWVLHVHLGVPRPEVDPLAEVGLLRSSLDDAAVESDQGQRALELVWEDLARHPGRYWRPGTTYSGDRPIDPPGGWRGADQGTRVAVLPSILRGEIWRGQDTSAVLQHLKRAGKLDHEPGKNTRRVRIGLLDLIPMYCFPHPHPAGE